MIFLLLAGQFLAEPYLQLGDNPKQDLTLMWQTGDKETVYTVQTRGMKEKLWSSPVPAASRRIAVPTVDPHRVWSAQLRGLNPGLVFRYRVLDAGKPVFESNAIARKSPQQPTRLVVFGDCAQGTPEQQKIAEQAARVNPDYLFVTGDIVYSRGRITEYRDKFFPYYHGLLRSFPFIAAPGNHDVAERDFGKYPDTQAYYYYWAQPLNGPLAEPGPFTSKTTGPPENVQAFRDAAGSNYPRMANFSFDYGNIHWTVLDANPYTDWNDSALNKWVADDLKSAKDATWRFVGFHHPGFNSSVAHFKEQHMRVLAPVFEEGKVDIVFTGHVHNYQRSYPLFYDPATSKWTLDKSGSDRPKGVIYLVTGGGGARLYNPEQQDDPKSWQEFTHKFVSRVNSMTVVDANARQLSVRQIDLNGLEVDRFTVKR